jgi:hypothetical protein
MGAHPLPCIDLPIPADVKPGPGWSKFMVELAAVIGPYDVLRLCEAFGGTTVYVPVDDDKSPFLPVVGRRKASAIARCYCRSVITVPIARFVINRARRAGVIASVRAGHMTAGEAARILHMRRDSVSRIVNATDEGIGADPVFTRARKVDPRQIDMFPDTSP